MAAAMIFGRRGCVAAASIRNQVWKSFELGKQKIQSRPSLLCTLGSTRRLESYGVPLDNGKINAEVLRDHIEIRKSFMPNVLLKNVHSDKISQMILEMEVSNELKSSLIESKVYQQCRDLEAQLDEQLDAQKRLMTLQIECRRSTLNYYVYTMYSIAGISMIIVFWKYTVA